MRSTKTWVSLLILLVIGLHAVPVLSYQGYRQTRWPFMAWAMYAASQPPGPIQTTNRRIVGLTTTGQTEQVTPKFIGMSRPGLNKAYVQPLWNGDSSTAGRLFDRLNQGRPDPFVELRVEGEKFTLSDSGVVEEPLPVITYRSAPRARR